MRRSLGPIILITLGLILVLAYLALSGASLVGEREPAATFAPEVETIATVTAFPTASAPAASATRTPQPVVPTATATAQIEVVATETPTPSAPSSSTPAPSSETPHCPLPDCRARFGVSGRLEDVAAAAEAGLPFGNYFNWWLQSSPPLQEGSAAGDEIRFWQLVPVTQEGPAAPWSKIDEVVAAQPGSIWIVGNEPDVAWQDNTTAESYAVIYHDVYSFIKDRDPSARIAIAGVAQPSPLRFTYLEKVLLTYQDLYGQPMPVDIWTIHAFILREQADSWGIGIPPGMDESSGLLYEIADHNDLDIFRQSLISFREWMAGQGYAGKPLVVTEFGILHPADYGFPPEVVADFMLGAFDFLVGAKGDGGDPEDDKRLFQNWFWYSVYDDGDFPTGNLYDPQSGELTVLGQAYRDYLTGD